MIWWLEDDSRLSYRAGSAIQQAGEQALFSAASIWELAIKRAAGRYAGDDLLVAVRSAGFTLLAMSGEHAKLAGELPPHHRDPFDRMLVAQALLEDRVLVTSDAGLSQYGVPVLW